MNPPNTCLKLLAGVPLALAVLTLVQPAAHAATINKTNNSDNLNLTTSWTGGVVPGAADIAQWTSTVTGANSTVLGADLSWGGIKIVGPGGAVTIGYGNTLTLGTSGIDLSTATTNLTLNCGLTLRNSGQQSWKAAAGRTLNVAGTFTRTGAVVDFTSFNATATLGTLANDASGILGPWATTGSGTTLNYVTSTGGAVLTYTGQTAATAADLSNVTDANVNYSLAKPAGGTTLTGNITANTLRVTSSSDNAITNAGNSITLNGLIGVGANRTIITGAGNLVIGATKELVVNWTAGFSAIACPVVNNPGGASSVIINKPTNGENTFGAAGVTSTYTGGTIINYPAGGQLNCYSGSFGSGPITLNGGALRFYFRDGSSPSNSLTINGVDYIRTSGTFTGPIALNASTRVIANISGNVSGTGGVTVDLAGTYLFSGTNTYSGNTTVTTATLTLATNGSLKFFPAANGLCNKITGTGTANLNGTLNIDFTGAAIANGNAWTLVDVTTKTYGGTFAVSGFTGAAGIWTKTVGNNTWTFTQATGVLSLTVSAGVSATLTITAGGGGNVIISGTTTPATSGVTLHLWKSNDLSPGLAGFTDTGVTATTLGDGTFSFSPPQVMATDGTQTFYRVK